MRVAMKDFPKPLKVYAVEDSVILGRLLASTIEAAGAELIGISSGAHSAVADLAVLQPDLILIDLILDSGSGFEVLQEIKSRGLAPSAVKVVLTNHATSEYEKLCFQLGAHRFFDKASETSEVLALIHALAAEKRRLPGQSHKPGLQGRGGRRN